MVILRKERLLGLLERLVEVAELLGVTNSELVDTVGVRLGRCWGTGFLVFTALLSIGFSTGDVPRSPEEGSKTLSADSIDGSGIFDVDIFGLSDRSNMRLLDPCSATSVASSLWLSCESGSKVKSSRRISTISR